MDAVAAVDLRYNSSPLTIERRVSRSRKAEIRQISSSPSAQLDRLISTGRIGTSPQPLQPSSNFVMAVDGQVIVVALKDIQHLKESLDSTPVQANALAERLDQIKSRLALSITQMAELFGVTRKSVYDWYEGAEPRSATTDRIEILIDVLTAASAELDMRRLKAVWNIAVGGKSFRAVFSEENLDSSNLRTALTAKLHELSPRMVATNTPTHKATVQLGDAHLSEFDRSTDNA